MQYAFDEKIGCIVIDNFSEIEMVKEIAESRKENMNVLIRVTPGVEASTHDYITTGQEDSKFGFDLKNGQTDEAFLQLYDHPYINILRYALPYRFSNIRNRCISFCCGSIDGKNDCLAR